MSAPTQPFLRGGRAILFWSALLAGVFVFSGGGFDRTVEASAPVVASDDSKDFDRAKKNLQAVLKGKKQSPVRKAVEQLAATGDPRAVRLLVITGEQRTEELIYTAVEDALIAHSDEAWIQALAKELRGAKSNATAILLIESLGLIEGEATVGPLVTGLQSTRTPVLLAAVRACRTKLERAVVPALIDLLQRVEEDASLIWAETRITLQVLTSERYLHSSDWLNWWKTRPADWTPRKGRNAEDGAKTGVYRPAGGDGAALPRIFGQEVASKRVVFVIDTSGSMSEVDPPTEVEEGSTGKQGRTRLQRAQRELIAAIGQLRPDVRFNVVSFSTRVSAWVDGKLVKAKKSAKRKATGFVGALKPDGTTSTELALMQALETTDVDTIIFLSDGSPTDSTGKVIDYQPILEVVRAANREKNVTIHTLGFPGSLVSFMRALAEQTGGTYAPIR